MAWRNKCQITNTENKSVGQSTGMEPKWNYIHSFGTSENHSWCWRNTTYFLGIEWKSVLANEAHILCDVRLQPRNPYGFRQNHFHFFLRFTFTLESESFWKNDLWHKLRHQAQTCVSQRKFRLDLPQRKCSRSKATKLYTATKKEFWWKATVE